MRNGNGQRQPLEIAAETALIKRAAAGDGKAFHELVQRYKRAVYLTALSIIGNEADAEDLAQEAMLKAYRNLPGFRQDSTFRTWLVRITVNEALMRRRKDRRYRFESLDEPHEDSNGQYEPKDIPDMREIPLQTLERKELRNLIAKSLASLPSTYHCVVVLRDIEHFSIAETARILGLSESSVKTRLLRGRLRMRDVLAPLLRDFSDRTGTPRSVPLRVKHDKRHETYAIDPTVHLAGCGPAAVVRHTQS